MNFRQIFHNGASSVTFSNGVMTVGDFTVTNDEKNDEPAFIDRGETLTGNYLNLVGIRGFAVTGNYCTVRGEGPFTVSGNYMKILSGDDVTVNGDYCEVHSTNGKVTGNYNEIHGRGNRISGNYNKDKSRSAEAKAALVRMQLGFYDRGLVIASTIASLSSGEGHQRQPQPVAQPAPVGVIYPAASTDPEPAEEDDAKQCVICATRGKTTVCVPCAHSYACVTCVLASKPTTCAICRLPLERVMRIHMA